MPWDFVDSVFALHYLLPAELYLASKNLFINIFFGNHKPIIKKNSFSFSNTTLFYADRFLVLLIILFSSFFSSSRSISLLIPRQEKKNAHEKSLLCLAFDNQWTSNNNSMRSENEIEKQKENER